jgi:hypothetical protein
MFCLLILEQQEIVIKGQLYNYVILGMVLAAVGFHCIDDLLLYAKWMPKQLDVFMLPPFTIRFYICDIL